MIRCKRLALSHEPGDWCTCEQFCIRRLIAEHRERITRQDRQLILKGRDQGKTTQALDVRCVRIAKQVLRKNDRE